MTIQRTTLAATMAATVAALLAGADVAAENVERPIAPTAMDIHPPQSVERVRPTHISHAAPVIPEQEPAVAASGNAAAANAGFATTSAFTRSIAQSTTGTALAAPVTLDYAGSSPVLSIQDTGTNRGVSAVILNSHDNVSALYGQTNGGGAGLTGYNYGTSGPAAKFGVVNGASAQPGVFATTNGTGPAVLGTITTTNSSFPALMGQNTGTADYGIGVEGIGNAIGIMGTSSAGYAVYGTASSGDAVFGTSSSGNGVNAHSDSGVGLYATSNASYAIYANSGTGSGIYAESTTAPALVANNLSSGGAITAHTANGIGILSTADVGYGIWGQSTGGYGVLGEDFTTGTGVYGFSNSGLGVYGYSKSGSGVYGYSASGYAGNFAGKVTATSYVTTSDRNAKTRFHAIDAQSILDRVDQLPITSWDFKTDLNKHHVGPMAQDFHAAFGLDGTDDTHINLTDAVGVSLASIQALSQQMKAKDAEIAALKSQLARVSARMTAFEQQRDAAIQSAALRAPSGARANVAY